MVGLACLSYHNAAVRSLGCSLLCLALIGGMGGMATVRAAEPLARAHAHNDYEHPRPLLDALSHGFCSVEADVFAIDGELRVAHDRVDTRPGRTLQKLYLDPLQQRVAENGGRVYKNGPLFTLLIDFKSAGPPTYALLKEVLEPYRAMLVPPKKGKLAAVSIVISGNRPFDVVLADKQRLVGIDGRLSDLDSDMPSTLMPLISDNWGNHFRWRGEGAFPKAEREKLHKIVKKAHAAGRRVRFWATPESEQLWEELNAAKLDHINTDQLARLAAFLRDES